MLPPLSPAAAAIANPHVPMVQPVAPKLGVTSGTPQLSHPVLPLLIMLNLHPRPCVQSLAHHHTAHHLRCLPHPLLNLLHPIVTPACPPRPPLTNPRRLSSRAITVHQATTRPARATAIPPLAHLCNNGSWTRTIVNLCSLHLVLTRGDLPPR